MSRAEPEVRPEGMRAPEGNEERNTLDADGGRSYGAPDAGPGGSSRIATVNDDDQLDPIHRAARPIRDEGSGWREGAVSDGDPVRSCSGGMGPWSPSLSRESGRSQGWALFCKLFSECFWGCC